MSDRFEDGWSLHVDAEEAFASVARNGATLRASLADYEEAAKAIEGLVLLTGGTEAFPIDGKNEAERKAQLRRALQDSNGWANTMAEIRRLEGEIAQGDAERAIALNALSRAKRQMDYAIVVARERTLA